MNIATDINAARRGCRDNQATLLKQYEAYLATIARAELPANMRTKNGESDFVQRTFTKALDHFDQFRGTTRDDVKAWLRSIMVNELRQEKRAFSSPKRDVGCERRLDDSSCDFEIHDRMPTPRSDAIAKEEIEALYECMGRLPEDYRTVVQLRSWDRRPFKEIAESMNRSVNSVEKLWARAILRLQEELETPRRTEEQT